MWQQDGVEIINITCCAFDSDVYIICAIDDMGMNFIILFLKVYVMKPRRTEEFKTKSIFLSIK